MGEVSPLRGRGIGTLLRRPAQAVQARITSELAQRGFGDLTEAHMAVFIHIDPDGSRLTALAERGQITVQSMGYLVDNLVAGGYLERARDPRDGRAKLLRLTPRGWLVEHHAAEIARTVEEEWTQWLGKDELATLRRLLEELADHLKGPSATWRP